MNFNYRRCEELAMSFGDSFYILDKERFENNYQDLLESFCKYYSNTKIGYSYKTNYIPYLGQIVNTLGGFAEVTSELEYEIAIKNKVEGQKIILNGPIHQIDFLEKALLAGVKWNVDGFRQLEMLEEICKRNRNILFKVGLRLNIDNLENFESRFGFDVSNKSASIALAKVSKIKNCKVNGLHAHYWLPGRKVESFVERLRRLIEFAKNEEILDDINYINVGGSFYGPLSDEISEQIEGKTPSYNDYGKALGSVMKETFTNQEIALFIEPGVSLVGNTLDYFCNVYDIKKIGDRNIAVVDGSVHNVKPSLHRFDLKTTVYCKYETAVKKYDLVGYTCLEYDYLRKNILASINIGDFIRLHDVGAYTITIKGPFIKGAPPILYLSDGKVKLLRREENFEDILQTYEFNL